MPIGAPDNFQSPEFELSDYGRQLEAQNSPEVQAQRNRTHGQVQNVMQ